MVSCKSNGGVLASTQTESGLERTDNKLTRSHGRCQKASSSPHEKLTASAPHGKKNVGEALMASIFLLPPLPTHTHANEHAPSIRGNNDKEESYCASLISFQAHSHIFDSHSPT